MPTLISVTSFLPRNMTTSSRRIGINSNGNSFHHPTIITANLSSPIFHQLKNKLPNPQALKSPLTTIFKSSDEATPSPDLTVDFAPVGELPPTACDVVEGSLPCCLDGGAYIRNSPNPQFIPKGLVEGDGMLHMIKFFNGKATFCCRQITTHKHTVGREMGDAFVPSFNGRSDPINHGSRPSNTSLVVNSGRLFALCESDLPYAVDITAEGDIKILGRHDFGASEPSSKMTEHPKMDKVTGEVFGYEHVDTPPLLMYFRIDSDGRKHKHAAIPMDRFTAIHDFAVTERYAVIPDVQIVVDPWSILKGKSPVEVVDREKVARVGIIPRYAQDEGEMVWVEAAGFNPVHCVNAWEEDGGDTVCVVASNVLAEDELSDAQQRMEKIVVDVKAKTVKRQTLSPEFLEFGIVNPAYAAKKIRYVYAIIVRGLRLIGLVKLDLNKEAGGGDCTVATRRYEPSYHSSELFFVAREPNNPAAEEDDGYLVTCLHDDNTQESKFIVMDAKSPNLDVITAVKLPQRIPTGFNSLFLSETDLINFKKSC